MHEAVAPGSDFGFDAADQDLGNQARARPHQLPIPGRQLQATGRDRVVESQGGPPPGVVERCESRRILPLDHFESGEKRQRQGVEAGFGAQAKDVRHLGDIRAVRSAAQPAERRLDEGGVGEPISTPRTTHVRVQGPEIRARNPVQQRRRRPILAERLQLRAHLAFPLRLPSALLHRAIPLVPFQIEIPARQRGLQQAREPLRQIPAPVRPFGELPPA